MNRNRYTDEALIAAIQKGGKACDEALGYLYRTHVGKVIPFIMARNGTEEEAKDIFQDALVSLLMSIRKGSFEGKSSLQTFLFAISKNLWYRRFSRNQLSENYKANHVEETVEQTTPFVSLMDQDQQKVLEQLLGKLKPKCREVLNLWAQKYSMKEIAAELGYSSEQVARNKKTACLKELKELVRTNPEIRALVQEMRMQD